MVDGRVADRHAPASVAGGTNRAEPGTLCSGVTRQARPDHDPSTDSARVALQRRQVKSVLPRSKSETADWVVSIAVAMSLCVKPDAFRWATNAARSEERA